MDDTEFPSIADDFEFLHSLDPRVSEIRRAKLVELGSCARAKLAEIYGKRMERSLLGESSCTRRSIEQLSRLIERVEELSNPDEEKLVECVYRQAARLPAQGQLRLYERLQILVGGTDEGDKNSAMIRMQFRVSEAEAARVRLAHGSMEFSPWARNAIQNLDLYCNRQDWTWPVDGKLVAKLWFRLPLYQAVNLRRCCRRNQISMSQLLRTAILIESANHKKL
jgi:hypothetical protein